MNIYHEYFGLKENPFAITPDPHYLYLSAGHREALAHLVYGINSNGGFTLLTGEIGTGKTTLTRCLLEDLPENTEIAFILNPKLTVEELLAKTGFPSAGSASPVRTIASNMCLYAIGIHPRQSGKSNAGPR